MKAKNFTFLMGALFFLAIGGVRAQNLLVDGDFSTTTEIPVNDFTDPQGQWVGFVNIWNGADMIPTVESGVCRFEVNNGGWDLWEVQLIQNGFPLILDHTYRLTFDAKSDYERWFGVYLGESGGDWYSIIGGNEYYQLVGTEWKAFTLEFVAGKVFPIHKFSLEFGGYGYGNMWFDNFVLEDLGKLPIYVGILGTAVDNWDVDVDLATSDEITYTLQNYPLKSGVAKFRQNDKWNTNWGGPDFPSGTGYQDGPDIPVYNAGNYDITFNRLTGGYAFECVNNCSPLISVTGNAIIQDTLEVVGFPMWTGDGVSYLVGNLNLEDGGLKFRLDNDPAQMWGGTGFPDGVAVLNGPPIPVKAGHYEIFFNLVSGEYHFKFPNLGILGSALNGWDTDINMETNDGVVYTLKDQLFTDGYVKFRLNDSWDHNWGGYEFPYGYAWMGGPDLPVMAGTYDLTFNILSGEYFFVATTCPVPGIRCPDYVYVANDPGECGAMVWYPDLVPTPNCGGGGVTIVQTAGLPSGSFFPVGTTTNSFVLTNEQGMTAECSFDVMVFDTEAPVISNLSVEFDPFSPPNHKMIPVTVNFDVFDNCGIPTCEIYVYTSEPENGIGDGNTLVDTEVIDVHHILIRAERSGPGDGRYFYIVLLCHDESWNSDYRQVILFIPHDNRDGGLIGPKSATISPLPAGDPSGLQLWPNPSTGHFNLLVDAAPEVVSAVRVTDCTGRILSAQKVTGPQILRFGEELAPGIYLLNVRQGEQSKTLKMIKK
jgi:hypothetical protein